MSRIVVSAKRARDLAVPSSPDKDTLISELSVITDEAHQTREQALQYVEHIKVSTAEKANAYVADKEAGWKKAAQEYEETARDITQSEVAKTEAWVVGQAESVISQKEAQHCAATSSVGALRNSLTEAQQEALREQRQNAAITSEARDAL